MMGHQPNYQHKLFVTGFNLNNRIRNDHPLRKIQEKIDFHFIYGEVEDTYGSNGNVSVPPPVILKMLLLLILYNVRSERELMATIPERLDWLWFLGYDLDDEIPNHSVLSKARARWGVAAFRDFFERIVWQCVEAGLVDGSKLFVDASLVDADASNNSVVDTQKLKKYLNKSYKRLENRLDDLKASKKTPADSRYISTTDPDASVTRHSGSKSKLRYKTHRAVDEKNEIITVTKVTAGSVDDGHVLENMIEAHEQNTQYKLETVVADSKYGTRDNFLLCHDRKIKAHIPSIEDTQRGSGRQKGIFPKEDFIYDPETDTFICPAGQTLRKRNYNKKRKCYEYKASSEICAQCKLKKKCTRAKDGRSLKRHARQEELEVILKEAGSRNARRDIKHRQDLSERSFAWSTRYGYKRARWRSLWRMGIQDFLIAAVQNITILIRQPKDRMSKSNARAEEVRKYHMNHTQYSVIEAVLRWFSGLSNISLRLA
ncbi:MAG: IS1182 family transposase [Deltaproteobacteria bacterium]|nr:IS1182 family transposase [Deltaproteobacteria bacterium]